ncbi:MAG: adenylate/guanylate cyclase domain-containing protein, partial [Fulvivirga sp.]|nr:adenylate/guanylate cyclase domain-containing protein [Fulvivirga sp.]
KEQLRDASLTLSDLYKNFDQYDSAYIYYRKFIAYRDSLINIEQVKEMANLSTDFKVSLKQAEVDLLNQQKETQRIVIIAVAVTLFLIMLLAFGLYRRYKFIKATNRIIASEKEKSETLLLNILPAETAEELKNHGKVNAQQFNCSVLFTDFKEFTSYAEKADPQLLVESIDYYFREFDKVITKYGLEKIKTIGDAYMCAGGLPVSTQTHAKDVVLAAKEILEIVKREFHKDNDLLHFEVRMGIHTGTVIAGIVGLKKWQYDIWGDAVNIASRMESMSEPGKINLSESTYQKIKDEFPCTYRGEVEVKHRGALKMYFLD